ncbi:MAG: glutamine-hydrolyzing GMP synthase, partial [Erysipelotrichales bacterium]
MDKQYILVLDYGSQYNQLIVRRIRELGVYSILEHHDLDIEKLKQDKNLKGIILSGGPNSVYDEDSFTIDSEIYNLNVPILGLCYGMQLITHQLGGKVEGSDKREFGKTDIDIIEDGILFKNTNPKQVVWMSHTDKVNQLPDGFTNLASSSNTEFVAFENKEKQIYGLQFHPEVTHSEYGNTILENFVKECNVQDHWSMEDVVDQLVQNIRDEVKDDKVLLALSGGVDSSVVAFLLEKAIGHNLTCVFVDHGLLRKNEFEQVCEVFSNLDIEMIAKQEEELFFNKLKGVTEPETKRKIIGNTFIDVFDDVAASLKDVKY